jgi:glycogen debranching enzyme
MKSAQSRDSAAVNAERVLIGEQHYILASALAPRQHRELLSHGDCFAIVDRAGDIPLSNRDSYGLFYRDTRFLDRFELRLNGEFPILLSTAPSDDGSELVTHLSNTDEQRDGEIMLARDTVALQRTKAVVTDTLYEQLQLHNYGRQSLALELTVLFGADFADMFEIRGARRRRRGQALAALVEANASHLSYRGLDDIQRETVVTFDPPPHHLGATVACFDIALPPGGEATFDIRVHCRVGDEASPRRWRTFARSGTSGSSSFPRCIRTTRDSMTGLIARWLISRCSAPRALTARMCTPGFRGLRPPSDATG